MMLGLMTWTGRGNCQHHKGWAMIMATMITTTVGVIASCPMPPCGPPPNAMTNTIATTTIHLSLSPAIARWTTTAIATLTMS